MGLRFTRPHRHAGVDYGEGDVLPDVTAEQAEKLAARLPVEVVDSPERAEDPDPES